jgi:hypothetical protein
MAVAACLPYVLLALFADFIHPHPIVDRDAPQIQIATAIRVGTPPHENSKLPDYSCAVCQWLRAGIGLQASVALGPALASVAGDIAARLAATHSGPTLRTPALRGPPLAPVV